MINRELLSGYPIIQELVNQGSADFNAGLDAVVGAGRSVSSPKVTAATQCVVKLLQEIQKEIQQ